MDVIESILIPLAFTGTHTLNSVVTLTIEAVEACQAAK